MWWNTQTVPLCCDERGNHRLSVWSAAVRWRVGANLGFFLQPHAPYIRLTDWSRPARLMTNYDWLLGHMVTTGLGFHWRFRFLQGPMIHHVYSTRPREPEPDEELVAPIKTRRKDVFKRFIAFKTSYCSSIKQRTCHISHIISLQFISDERTCWHTLTFMHIQTHKQAFKKMQKIAWYEALCCFHGNIYPCNISF